MMTRGRRSAALAPVLVFTTTVASIVSSLGAPLIPTISRNLHVSVSTAQWSLTVALLAGAVSAPVMGRLGDGAGGGRSSWAVSPPSPSAASCLPPRPDSKHW